jgi:hypothetical protein
LLFTNIKYHLWPLVITINLTKYNYERDLKRKEEKKKKRRRKKKKKNKKKRKKKKG